MNLTLLIIFSLISYIFSQSAEYFMVEKCEFCPDVPRQIVKFYMTPKYHAPGYQTVDFNLSSPKPIGENARVKTAAYLEINHKWREFAHGDHEFCQIFRSYVGEVFYTMERSAAIAPGTCPIPKGIYHGTNHTIDFRKLKLQALPLGRMKFRLESYDKTTKEITSCLLFVIKNVEQEA